MWASSFDCNQDNFASPNAMGIKRYSTRPSTFSNSFWASSFRVCNEKTHPSNARRSHCILDTYSCHFAMHRTWVSLKTWIFCLFDGFDILLLSTSPSSSFLYDPQSSNNMLQTLISCITKSTPKIVAYRTSHKLSTLLEHTNSLSSLFWFHMQSHELHIYWSFKCWALGFIDARSSTMFLPLKWELHPHCDNMYNHYGCKVQVKLPPPLLSPSWSSTFSVLSFGC